MMDKLCWLALAILPLRLLKLSLEQLDLDDFKGSFDRLMYHPNFCQMTLDSGTSDSNFAVIFGFVTSRPCR